MDISAIFKAVLVPDQERGAERFADLKPGDRLTGRVLKMEADGRVLIDLGRFRAMADTTVPVQVGQRLALKVVQTGVPIQLRLEPDAQPKMQPANPRLALATLLPPGDQQRVVQTIERLLTASVSAEQIPLSGEGTGRVTTATSESAPAALETKLRMEAVAQPKGTIPETVRQALIQLKAVFEPMVLEAPVAQRTQWVQSNVEDRGILFEMKLADALDKGAAAQVAGPTEEMPVIPKEAQPAARTLPEAKIVTDIKVGVDSSVLASPKTGLDTPLGPDPKMELALKIDPAPKGDPDPTRDKSTLPPPTAAEAEATEIAQRIIARDLKPHLLILKSFLGGLDDAAAGPAEANSKDVAFLRQAVNQMTTHVEQQQEQAVRRSGEQDLYQVFTHLLPVKEQQQPVQLKVYYPKKGRAAEGDPQHRVALLLMLDRLGAVRADLSMVESTLRIGFSVRDPEVQQVFEEHKPAIEEALAGVFDQVQITTQVSREKIAQFEGEDLMGPPVGRIDVQA
ncbi:MAG: hypothetical protein WAU91_08475 [Desulfatitalea sp.]